MYDKNTIYIHTWKKIHFGMKIIFYLLKNVTLILEICHPRHTMLIAFKIFLKYGPLEGFLGTIKKRVRKTNAWLLENVILKTSDFKTYLYIIYETNGDLW